ncbi:hypothetical protein [uncultured Clostridium sp.]|uniref:hypothetical protein n=1 Tax=uncultured Clostridium sp. TaxID=59620 RepID=UPI0026042D2B|nr:hypothetical protein [uncultured Clostridium sp.]
MKSVSIVLLIASFLLVIMGLFLIVMSSKSQNEAIKSSKVNGIGNLVLGLIGTTIAIIYQFVEMDKNIILVLFFGSAVIISVIQILVKRKLKK